MKKNSKFVTKKRSIIILAKNIDSGTGTFVLQFKKLQKDFMIFPLVLERKRYRSDKEDRGVTYFSRHPTYRGFYKISPSLLVEFLKQIYWLRNYLTKKKPELIVSLNTHCIVLSVIAVLLAGSSAKQMIIFDNNVEYVFNSKLPKGIRKLCRIVASYFFNSADLVIAVSKGVARDVGDYFSIRKPITVISYGINLNIVKRNGKEKISESDENVFKKSNKTLISVGRLEAQKDFKTLIEALKLIREERKDVNLVIVGDGSQKNQLMQFAKKIGVKPYVHFLGWRSNVEKYIRRADIFVHSSLYEGFGLVLVEALGLGIPVVSANSPHGPEEILGKGKYGSLVSVGNANEFKNEVCYLLEHQKKEQNTSGLIDRASYYSEEKMLLKYKKVIKKILL